MFLASKQSNNNFSGKYIRVLHFRRKLKFNRLQLFQISYTLHFDKVYWFVCKYAFHLSGIQTRCLLFPASKHENLKRVTT